IDVAPFLRAALLTDDTSAMSSEQAAGLASMLDLLAPDIEMDMSAMDMPGFGVFRGLAGVREFFIRWLEVWEHYSWTFSNWREVREHVIVDAEARATGTSSGADVVLGHCHVFTWRDGKMLRWRVFPDRGSALA